MTTNDRIDPSAFLRAIERAWQARDGEAAAAEYAHDAVQFYGTGQRRSGEELRQWPERWFAYATDLHITKTLRAFDGTCLTNEWESRYTHPVTGRTMLERGAEFRWIRDGRVSLHHMFEHTWAEGDAPAAWPASET